MGSPQRPTTAAATRIGDGGRGSDPSPRRCPRFDTNCARGLTPGADPRASAARRVELAGEVLELAPQLLVLEDLIERGRLEALQRLEGGRRVLHQVPELEARLHRLEGVVGDPEIVRGALTRLRHLLALLQQITPLARG